MKTKRWLYLLLFTPFVSYSQPNIPEYGSIDKNDLLLSECSFDSGAVAFKLLDYGKVRFAESKNRTHEDLASRTLGQSKDFDIQLRIITEIRVRIKVLKTAGIHYGDVKIPFHKTEKISKVSGCTYNLDAKENIVVSPVDEKDIYTNKLNSEFNSLVIVLNNVKVGSVIEYKYVLDSENDTYIRDWYFQGEIPVRLSYYNINIPLAYNFGENALINHPLVVNTMKEITEVYNQGTMEITMPTANRVIYLTDVASIKKEPYMGASKDYLQHIYYHLVVKNDDEKTPNAVLTPWRALVNRFGEIGGVNKSVLADIPGSEALVNNAKQQVDTADKIKSIYNYLSNNIACSERETIFPSLGAEQVWEKATGNMADINLLLVNLLQKVGVNALPFIGSTYNNGTVVIGYPSLRQFNVLMAYVPTANGFYLLDATNWTAMPHLIPYEMIGTKGLIINRGQSIFLDIQDNNQQYKQVVNVLINVNDKGEAKGTALVKSDSYAKVRRLNTWVRTKDKFIAEYLAHPQLRLSIDSLVVKNEMDATQPLDQYFNFLMPVNSSGEYSYLNTNLFTGLYSNPFTNNERLTDVEFRYKQAYYLNVTIVLPDGFAYEELPKGLNLVMPDKSIECRREVIGDDNIIKLMMALVFNKADFPADEYGFLKEYYKKLQYLLEEPIVIKKK